MMTGLKRIPKIQLYGITDTEAARFSNRLGVFAFDVKGRLPGKIAGMMSDQAASGLWSGCHCVHILVNRMIGVSRPLERFQALIIRMFPRLSLPGMVRGSIGLANTTEEVDTFLKVLQHIASGKNKKESKGFSSAKKILKHNMAEYRNFLTEKVFPVG
jgi:selenocysteine lyase/cysteine desulfurase